MNVNNWVKIFPAIASRPWFGDTCKVLEAAHKNMDVIRFFEDSVSVRHCECVSLRWQALEVSDGAGKFNFQQASYARCVLSEEFRRDKTKMQRGENIGRSPPSWDSRSKNHIKINNFITGDRSFVRSTSFPVLSNCKFLPRRSLCLRIDGGRAKNSSWPHDRSIVRGSFAVDSSTRIPIK